MSYYGGKSGNGTYQNIINHIPKCKIYVEPFFGYGGVFKNLNLPELTVINDIDSGLMDNLNYDGQGEIIKIFSRDYRDVINIYDGSETVIYLDPPYLMESRKSQKKVYKHEFNYNDHVDILNYVSCLKSKVILSHYPNNLYDSWLKDWSKFLFESQTRQGKATECLYMNFDINDYPLQDYRYIGDNYIDRQRIKRQNERIIRKITMLQHRQKEYLLNQILTLSI